MENRIPLQYWPPGQALGYHRHPIPATATPKQAIPIHPTTVSNKVALNGVPQSKPKTLFIALLTGSWELSLPLPKEALYGGTGNIGNSDGTPDSLCSGSAFRPSFAAAHLRLYPISHSTAAAFEALVSVGIGSISPVPKESDDSFRSGPAGSAVSVPDRGRVGTRLRRHWIKCWIANRLTFDCVIIFPELGSRGFPRFPPRRSSISLVIVPSTSNPLEGRYCVREAKYEVTRPWSGRPLGVGSWQVIPVGGGGKYAEA